MTLLDILAALARPFAGKTPVAPPPPQPPRPSPADRLFEDWLLASHNRARAAYGLPPLAHNAVLTAAAAHHAKWMSEVRPVPLTHDEGTVPFEHRLYSRGYDFASAGENVAAGQLTVEEVTNKWLGSTPHRANILSAKYTEVGFGREMAVDGLMYWCVVFARPLTRNGLADPTTDCPPGLDERRF